MKVEMKDSGIPWVGEIPKIWSVVQLSSIFKEHKDKNKLLEENNLLSLSYGRIIRKDINTKEGLLPQSFDGYNIIQEGDIVFRLTDLQNDKRSLRTGLCKEKGIITSAYITIRKTQELHSEFFHYLLHSYDECKVFYGLGDGVRQGMSFDDLRKLLLVAPPFHIQQQIANFLDDKCADIDQLIALQQQMIDELKAYKQSVITEAVCKGLDKSVPMKDSGIEWIGEVPKGWKIRKVKTLSIMINGYAFDSQKFGLNNKNKVLRIGDIFDGVINREITTNIDDVIELEKYILQENDIVIALSGATVGKIGYVNNLNNEKIYVNQRVGIIRADNHKLLFYFLQSNVFRKYVELLSWGSAQPNISLNQIGEFKIPFSVSDGLSIVSYLDQKCSQIDTLISIKQQKIEELKEYKKSMIYEYITGKKQVPNE